MVRAQFSKVCNVILGYLVKIFVLLMNKLAKGRIYSDVILWLYILMILQNICFRIPERFMIKAHIFINGCSLKKRCKVEHDLLRYPRRASLKGLHAALLISIREQPFSSINALPLSLLILAETSISR